MQLVGNNPVFRQLHEYNVQIKQMKKQQSLFKVLGKLSRIIIGTVGRGEVFFQKEWFLLVIKLLKTDKELCIDSFAGLKKKARRTELLPDKGSDPSAKRYRFPRLGQV